jgi:hypothetical protein
VELEERNGGQTVSDSSATAQNVDISTNRRLQSDRRRPSSDYG